MGRWIGRDWWSFGGREGIQCGARGELHRSIDQGEGEVPAEANGRVLRGEIAETSVEWEGTEQETEKVGCLLHETREKDEWIDC